jgi:hypothetical protein
MTKKIVVPNKCRVCGCTEETPCDLGEGDRCAWFDFDHTLCDRLACIAAVPLAELEELAILWTAPR